MESLYVDIELANSYDTTMVRKNLMHKKDVKRMHINIMMDARVFKLCINEKIQSELDLPFVTKERVRRDDGRIEELDVAGPIEIQFGDRIAFCNAIVLPGDTKPILGILPIRKMNLMVDSQLQKLVIDPNSFRLPTLRPINDD